MNVNWKHILGTALVVAAGLVSYLASSQGAPVATAMHLSSGVLGFIGTVVLLLQNSIVGPGDTTAAKTAAKVTGVLLLLGGLAVGTQACGWWSAGGSQTVVTQGADTAACELAQVESTGSFSLSSLLACVGGVASDLLSDLSSVLNYYTQPAPVGDAGLVAAGVLCGDATKPPPYAGAPACLPISTLSMLRDVYGQAKVAAGAR